MTSTAQTTTEAPQNPEHISDVLKRMNPLGASLQLVANDAARADVANVAAEAMIVAASEAVAPPRFSLRELSFEAQLIDAALTASEGELTPELEQRMDELSARLLRKADGVSDYLAAFDAEVGVIKAEEQRLAARRSALENRAERFKSYVFDCMTRMSIKKLDGDFHALRIQNNAPSLDLYDDALVPDEYKSTKTTTVIDRKALLAAAKLAPEGKIVVKVQEIIDDVDEETGMPVSRTEEREVTVAKVKQTASLRVV